MSHCIQYKDPADCSKPTCEGCPLKNSRPAEPTCPRYATELCDTCGPDDRQAGCYREIYTD